MIRFGAICTNGTLAAWQLDTIAHLCDSSDVIFSLLIDDRRQPLRAKQESRGPMLWPHHRTVWKLFHDICLTRWLPSIRRISVDKRFHDVPARPCIRERGGGFSHQDTTAIRSHNLDFILDFSTERPEGDILSASRYGIWSFAQGERDECGGDLSCFWAAYHGNRAIHMTLQRLSGARECCTILRSGHFQNYRHTYLRTLAHVHVAMMHWPAHVCRDIQRDDANYLDSTSSRRTVQYVEPTTGEMVGFVLRQTYHYVARAWTSLFFQQVWNIGIASVSIAEFLRPGIHPEVRWLPKPRRGSFIADPFATSEAVLFVEEFDYRTNKGYIATLTLGTDGSYSAPRRVIERPVHLSYPYLLQYNGEIYCVPETGGAEEIALYRSVSFPYHWTKVATLVEGFAGLDATVFMHDGYWWLFCTKAGRFSGVILYAWYAPDLLGPWTPHLRNPIKTDVRSSRPAGTPFVAHGQLYRPAQDCSRTYGGAVVLNRIVHLSPDAFEEQCVTTVTPDGDSPYRYGLHTLSAVGQRTLIDGKGRLSFAPTEALRHFHRRLCRSAPRALPLVCRRRGSSRAGE